MFSPTEVNLPRALKNFLDGALLARQDAVIQVFKVPTQPAAQSPAHTGLARAHEADQKDSSNFGWAHQSIQLGLALTLGFMFESHTTAAAYTPPSLFFSVS